MLAETAYLSFALLEPSTLDHHPVPPDWFSVGMHRRALVAMKALHAEGRANAIELGRVLGLDYVLKLPQVSEIPDTPSTLVSTLADEFRRRRLTEVLEELSGSLSDPTASVREKLAGAVGKLIEAQEEDSQVATFSEVLGAAFDRVEAAYNAKGILGTPTGWAKLDEIIGGWEPEKLYFVSARPGAGKTSFGLQAAVEAAKHGKAVYISSQEMGKTQLGIRLLSQEGRVSSERIRRGDVQDADWPKLTRASGVLADLVGWIDTRTGVNFDQLRASVLRYHAKQPVGLLLVDYVQMMRGSGESKVYELEHIAYGLKTLAKDLGAPVIALSQLNRGAEEDAKEPPKLSQMRGSGGLEQAADVVLILWKPKPLDPNTIEIRVAKHRDGRTGKFSAMFNAQYTLFE